MEHKSEFDSALELLTPAELVSYLAASSPEESSVYCTEIIRRFEPVLRFAWRNAARFIDYQDFVQDVFVKLFGNLPHLKDAEAFPGYFRQIALSVAHDHVRKSLAEYKRNPLGVKPEDLGKSFYDINEHLDVALFLQSYMARLEPRERAILSLEYFQGLSFKEMAKLFGTSAGAMRAAKYRLMNKLREMIREDAEDLDR